LNVLLCELGHQARQAHQGDVPTSRTDTQNVFLCRDAEVPDGRSASSRFPPLTPQPGGSGHDKPHRQDLETKGDYQFSRARQRDHDEPEKGQQSADHEDGSRHPWRVPQGCAHSISTSENAAMGARSCLGEGSVTGDRHRSLTATGLGGWCGPSNLSPHPAVWSSKVGS